MAAAKGHNSAGVDASVKVGAERVDEQGDTTCPQGFLFAATKSLQWLAEKTSGRSPSGETGLTFVIGWNAHWHLHVMLKVYFNLRACFDAEPSHDWEILKSHDFVAA